jgi:hypothetical protein
VDYPSLNKFAGRYGWKRFANVVAQIVEQVETEIMVEAAIKRKAGRPVNGKKPFKHQGRNGGPGRPRSYQRDRNAEPQTEQQMLMRQARDLYEAGKGTKASIAKLLGLNRDRVYHAARVENWLEPRVAKARAEFGGPPVTNYLAIIPPPSPDTAKAQMQITLSAIRAMMSVQQIEQLDGFEALVAKFGHLLEVYLDPHRFVAKGLEGDDLAMQVAKVQMTALQLLAPTKQDGLAIALKTYTDALMRSIELKRAIAGLNKLTAPTGDLGERSESERRFFDVDSLSTDELRIVQHGMELLERHQRAARELPIPPSPAPIDDLLGPEAVVVQEPEVPR